MSFSQIEELIAQGGLERLVSLSLEDLRSKFSTEHDRVEAVWVWLSWLVVSHVPWPDRMVHGLAMIDHLALLSGYEISSKTRQAFYARHFHKQPSAGE